MAQGITLAFILTRCWTLLLKAFNIRAGIQLFIEGYEDMKGNDIRRTAWVWGATVGGRQEWTCAVLRGRVKSVHCYCKMCSY